MRMPTPGLLFSIGKKSRTQRFSVQPGNYRSRCKVPLTGFAAASEWYIVFVRQNLSKTFIVRRIL